MFNILLITPNSSKCIDDGRKTVLHVTEETLQTPCKNKTNVDQSVLLTRQVMIEPCVTFMLHD